MNLKMVDTVLDIPGLRVQTLSDATRKDALPFKLLCLHDIHLGHHRVETEFILHNLAGFLLDKSFLRGVNLIVFAGDVFDRLIYLNQDFITDIDVFFIKFFKLCKELEIRVIFLEGTRSHDRGQSARLVKLNLEIAKIHADVEYISTLSVYHDERFGLDYLFVPDEWHHDPSVTLKQAQDLIHDRGLAQADFAFMHGNFHYQLPAIVKAPKHDEHAYLKLVRWAIFIGHIHIRSQFEWIYAGGSFDRLSQNEEGPKGFYQYELTADAKGIATFIENKNAKIHTRVDCRGLDTEEGLEKVSAVARTLPDESFIEVFVFKGSPLANTRVFSERFSRLRWNTKVEGQVVAAQVYELKKDLDYQPVYIEPNTVVGLVSERFEKQRIDSELRTHALDLLSTLVKEMAGA